MTIERHLTARDLAERWGLTVGHLANVRAAGKGVPFVKLPGRVLYRLADVEAYEQARMVEVAA